MIRSILKWVFAGLSISVLAGVAYGGFGYLDGIRDSSLHRTTANQITANGLGAGALNPYQRAAVLRVEDPNFDQHNGGDFKTSGAGQTTITQSLSKRLAFEEFEPGVGKLRQTGYALGLERELSKDQILTLWLHTVEMGRGPDGWVTGFFPASEAFFGRSVDELSDSEFTSLIAIPISPKALHPLERSAKFVERTRRIERLLSNACVPSSHRDVWLEGCAEKVLTP